MGSERNSSTAVNASATNDEDDGGVPPTGVEPELAQVAERGETEPERGPRTVAVIFPHPDDAEFSCAGTVARWVNEGSKVTYVLVTSGDKGTSDPNVSPEHVVATREAEQRRACEILGCEEPVFLRHKDATLVADLALRKELTAVIRRLKPDVVICGDPTVRWYGQNYLNHPDHIAAAEATLAAIFPSARDPLTFPELLAQGLEPHKVEEIYISGAINADVWIDITATMDKKIEALCAHVSQLGDWDPTESMREWGREDNKRNPAEEKGEYAESYKYLKLD